MTAHSARSSTQLESVLDSTIEYLHAQGCGEALTAVQILRQQRDEALAVLGAKGATNWEKVQAAGLILTGSSIGEAVVTATHPESNGDGSS